MNTIARFRAATRMVSLTLLLLLAYAARAQEGPAPVGKKGNWDISPWIASATGEENRDSLTEAQIWTAGVFIGKVITGEIGSGWRRGSLEYGFDLIPAFVTTKTETVYGGGFDPLVLRWNFSRRIGRFAPYIELGGGGVLTTANLPPGDSSSFNFMARGGGGIDIFTKSRQSLDVGLRWWHISNANLGLRNPEFNGLQISLGYHWFK